MKGKTTITFCSGVGTATGANFLLETEAGKNLVDCGLVQGSKFAEEINNNDFPYDPTAIKNLFITHAHADHIGRIPKLVRDGFRGVIWSTPETKRLAAVMLPDILTQMRREAEQQNIEPMYGNEDIDKALELWQEIPYHQTTTVADFAVTLRDAGHILGSTMFEFVKNGKKIVFTGDLGNSPTPLLPDTEIITDADYMVMESVYGDRNHEPKSERRAKLKRVINETVKRGGTIVIPAFSLERTQVILYELNNLIEEKEVQAIPVFLDSPLAIKVTGVYKSFTADFNKNVQAEQAGGDNIFQFPGLKFVRTADESKDIVRHQGSKIIIAGSGMSTGGRVIHHEREFLGDPQSTILMVGYQVAGSLGRELQDGAKSVHIEGQEIAVRAHVETIFGYSSHKDSDHLVEFVGNTAKALKCVWVAMGEPKSSLFLTQRLRDYLGVNAVYPKIGETVTLEI
jgi:metallo-beta-lactamase family protein